MKHMKVMPKIRLIGTGCKAMPKVSFRLKQKRIRTYVPCIPLSSFLVRLEIFSIGTILFSSMKQYCRPSVSRKHK